MLSHVNLMTEAFKLFPWAFNLLLSRKVVLSRLSNSENDKCIGNWVQNYCFSVIP